MYTRQITEYICQICESRHFLEDSALKCEGSHFGLDIRVYKEYRRLIEAERKAAYIVSCTNNEETRKALDKSIDATLKFIEDHGIAEKVKEYKDIYFI